MKKVKKDFWEEVFVYPSFNTRFGVTLFIILSIIFTITYIVLFKYNFIEGVANQIALLNLVVQSATLILGIFAAYYALRQLVETRFIGLDEAGNQELKRKHYSRAFDKWKEAFYIRPEAYTFNNICESLLLIGDYNAFDQYMRILKNPAVLKKDILQENSDKVIVLYLKSIRHLLVKNQGEAEKYILEIIDLIKKDGQPILNWDFLDLQTSIAYQDLGGECKNMAENLISYLQKNMSPVRKVEFELKKFASQI